MPEDKKEQPKRYDIEGFPYVTDALMETINSFPGLYDDEQFSFSSLLTNENGNTVVARQGSFIISELEDITGHVMQMCSYPFTVVCRSSGLSTRRKIQTKEWMDKLAEWLCRKAVEINGELTQLKRWPVLTGDREIRLIQRNTPAYLGGINDDKSETWVMDMVIQYKNEFDR